MVAESGEHVFANGLATDDFYLRCNETDAYGYTGAIGVYAKTGSKVTINGPVATDPKRPLYVNNPTSGGGTTVLNAPVSGTGVTVNSGTLEFSDATVLDGKKLTKFDYARYLAAGITYMFAGQQDAIGLVTFDTKIREYLPAKSSASQTRRILEFLDKSKPGGETDPAPVINDIAERIPSRGLVIVISDLFTSDADGLIKALHHFTYRKHEIVVLHVMAEEELTFGFDGHVHFENLEGPDEMMIDAKSIRASYLEQVNAFLKKIGDGVRKTGADYAPMNTKIPFDKALVEYLSRRRSGGR